jgi:hypothetical protein
MGTLTRFAMVAMAGCATAAFAGPPTGAVTRTDDGAGPVVHRDGGVTPQAGSPLRLEYTCDDEGNGFFR